MSVDSWQSNYDKIRAFRAQLKEDFGFHISEEMHTKYLLSDKNPYRKYGWTAAQKQEIVRRFTLCIANLDLKIINVIIDKTAISSPDYNVLEKALTYNIQRIENDSAGRWNYLIITDKGRIAPMRKTARAIRAFNPIQSKYSFDYTNHPIKGLIEDILEKDSEESYFIQICDFVSYFVHLYYKTAIQREILPNRVSSVVDSVFVKRVLITLRESNKLNLKANGKSAFGLVIYPKK